jgi:hypothetical protein
VFKAQWMNYSFNKTSKKEHGRTTMTEKMGKDRYDRTETTKILKEKKLTQIKAHCSGSGVARVGSDTDKIQILSGLNKIQN